MGFSDYFKHLWNYNENKNHIYCVFRIILDTYGIIMKINIIYILYFSYYFRHLYNYNKNKNHIYCVFVIIIYLWNYIENKYHIYCVIRFFLATYGITMKIKIIYIVFFLLF